jgi:hypothetical protein
MFKLKIVSKIVVNPIKNGVGSPGPVAQVGAVQIMAKATADARRALWTNRQNFSVRSLLLIIFAGQLKQGFRLIYEVAFGGIQTEVQQKLLKIGQPGG